MGLKAKGIMGLEKWNKEIHNKLMGNNLEEDNVDLKWLITAHIFLGKIVLKIVIMWHCSN